MICIGGVCVPYSAVIPLFFMGFRWVFAKLHLYGLLPSFVAKMINLNKSPSSTVSEAEAANADNTACCRDNSDLSSKPAVVKALESEEQFDDLLKKNEKFVVKFTASWCGPCKKINPFYKQKCTEYTDYDFLTVDVDDFDVIAQKYSIAMMPTFIVVKGSFVVGTYRGSSKPELEVFLQEHLR
jgi:thioredoxin 1